MFDTLYVSVEKEQFAVPVLFAMQSVRQRFLELVETRFDNDMDPDLLWISLLDPYMTNAPLITKDELVEAKARFLDEMILNDAVL